MLAILSLGSIREGARNENQNTVVGGDWDIELELCRL
jgi:hypothetical protein